MGSLSKAISRVIKDTIRALPNETEQKLSSMQLDFVKDLNKRIDDPIIRESILKMLPQSKMSNADLHDLTKEYSNIKKEIAVTKATQTSMAMGQKISDLVDKGVMSHEYASKLEARSTAAINAYMNIIDKRLEANRINMSRNKFLNNQGFNIRSANVLEDMDQNLNKVFSSGTYDQLNRILNDQANMAGMQMKLSSNDLSNELSKISRVSDLTSFVGNKALNRISENINNRNIDNALNDFFKDM